MKIYAYNSDIGTFGINQVGHERYELWIDEELLGSYESAALAAQDVAAFNTGYNEWDTLENDIENYPEDLGQWRKVEEEVPS